MARAGGLLVDCLHSPLLLRFPSLNPPPLLPNLTSPAVSLAVIRRLNFAALDYGFPANIISLPQCSTYVGLAVVPECGELEPSRARRRRCRRAAARGAGAFASTGHIQHHGHNKLGYAPQLLRIRRGRARDAEWRGRDMAGDCAKRRTGSHNGWQGGGPPDFGQGGGRAGLLRRRYAARRCPRCQGRLHGLYHDVQPGGPICKLSAGYGPSVYIVICI